MKTIKEIPILFLMLAIYGCSDTDQTITPVAQPSEGNPLQHLEQQLRRAEDTAQQQQQHIQGLQDEIQRMTGDGERSE